MDRFAELRAFVAVVENSGFTAAARASRLPRSTVSRLVMGLEERLNTQLLQRSTRSVATTSTGQVYYERARQVLDDLDEIDLAVTTTSSTPSGHLRISAPLPFQGINFAQTVANFVKVYPDMTVSMDLETRLVDPVSEGYDLIVRIARPDEETNLVDHRIATLKYVTCAAPMYVRKYGMPQTPADLRNHKLIVYANRNRMRNWVYQTANGRVEIKAESAMKTNNMEALMVWVENGLGISVLPEYALREAFKYKRLVKLLEDYELPKLCLQVIYPPTRHLSSKVRLFTDMVAEEYSAVHF
ncbi:LysR family transcriptional regulator for bpeEF and oprC [Thalassospira sp. MBR-102]|jgi:DNA-binding transcriptional LysR family regulator|uniref:LysR family transcriptional regulator n=1 Tax=Thalassospira TaxID=168934 RepID=UPI0008DE743E|nr:MULTISPECIES: LysR family transcriptional regulator [Thalassospira]MAB33550.1 LysR family transcriptional regulator [Thalassospira sp.]MDM7977454.1 LysR substrate-binding domain-containing protein [Thalassospira xiamenensis]OHY98125.1 hypothetical protein BC440_17185 [Thalassospira sp. MIT1004]HBS23991.1 LysR family transcriptional regulator [Thalassospira sp.]|tara:strand:- start:726 stop:1622 length:897 start_codon:yes stop_codon:yes gene_type:complete